MAGKNSMISPTPQQETYYPVTESELWSIYLTDGEGILAIKEIIQRDPIQSPIPNDEQCRICSQSEHKRVLNIIENQSTFEFAQMKGTIFIDKKCLIESFYSSPKEP